MDADLFFAKIAAEHMTAYLDSDVLFYPIDNLMVVSTAALHGINVPQLSIGAWLEAAWRLSARTLAPSDKAQLEAHRASVAAIRQKKNEVYGQKARREFKSRLDTWAWYLDDPKSAGRYPVQVHQRLKLALLEADVPQIEAEKRRLAGYDMRLRAEFKPGAFALEPFLQPIAPTSQYWWLYGTHKTAA